MANRNSPAKPWLVHLHSSFHRPIISDMSPRVEELRPIEQLKETNCFTVDLLSGDGEFNATLFDEQLITVSGFSVGSVVKFIVVGDKLLVFPEFQQHSMIYAFTKPFFQGQLQCAGKIDFNFSGDESRGPRRKIYGYSSSLRELPREDSDRYKQTVLGEKLGEYFVIE